MAKSANRIGILGGTFDPVHNGHIALARAALEQLKLDRVYMVLSPLSPFKLDRSLSPVQLRLTMLSMALNGEKGLFVGEWELKRRGPSYTVATLTDYRKKNPGDEVFLILGSDALVGFDRWKDPQKILKIATLVIGRRPNTQLKLSNLEGRMFFLKGLFPAVSSTEIRNGVGRDGRARNVAPQVAQFIKKNGLYGR